ncbi:MAG: mannonate dehydratase [Eubacteriales bacterium]|nr:mannonate dehydratase [Eubacteriales bacterium]MDD3881584.1 mannonate dehydratase [Eubacteriales bacterium]MDD4512357.1 mannonate dehydratase [Eubacteriales bacterium]
MHMTMRYFGSGFDSVSIKSIRQVPCVEGVISTLYGTMPGEVWKQEDYLKLRKEIEDAGLKLSGIESVNIHDDIKIGSGRRDEYIDNYVKTLEMLGKNDQHLICYNFMPVFDWTRSDLKKPRADGSTVLSYDQREVDKIDVDDLFSSMQQKSDGFVMPGWEPERMEHLKELFEMYKDVDEEKLFQNLVYFLRAIQPVCEKYDIKMAIHPDDPAWPVFGLPRIITGKKKIQRLLDAVDAPFNGLTLCTGSLGSNPENNLIDMIHAFASRIHFAHVRNIIFQGDKQFDETAHITSQGSLDIYGIIKALHDEGFDGPIRPDHGRMIWDEIALPGYGLYDRALGAMYMTGLWEAIDKAEAK